MSGVIADAVTMTPLAPPRSAHLDNAKALLITLVILAHSLGLLAAQHGSAATVNRIIYVFHMPAFIFVTGYLSKPDAFTRKGLRSVASLAFVYLVFNALNYSWSSVFEGKTIDLVEVVTTPTYALWFLLSLVWWRLLLPLFAFGKGREAALASIAVAVTVAVGSGYVISDGSWMSISRVFVFLPFFVTGYRARQQKWSIPKTWWSRCLAAIAFGGLLFAQYSRHILRGTETLMHRKSFLQLGEMTAQAGVGKLTILALSAVMVVAFLQLVPRRSLVITSLGATTLSVYVWHAFTLRNIRWFGFEDQLLGTLPALFVTVAVMVVVFGFGPIPRATQWLAGSRGPKRSS